MPVTFRINVNGVERAVTAEDDTPLPYVLRNDVRLNGPKFGCGIAQCGACTAIVNGEARAWLRLPASSRAASLARRLRGEYAVLLDESRPRCWTNSARKASR
jgi:nicotinate dehydrogenase subunit A